MRDQTMKKKKKLEILKQHYYLLYKDLSECVYNHYNEEEPPEEVQTLYLTGKQIELMLFILSQQMRKLNS